MAFGVSIIKIEDFAKWKENFDSDESVQARKAGGEITNRIFRSVDDPNTVVALWESDTLENMRKFAHSDELRDAMKEAGVIGIPETYYLEEVGKGTT